MKSPSYRKITKSAGKVKKQMDKSLKPKKAPSSKASKRLGNALMVAGPIAMGAVMAITSKQNKQGNRYKTIGSNGQPTGGSTGSRKSDYGLFKRKKR
jgi:hypothetical protein